MTHLVYTFGNHMHWVDMSWLWGYHVLPGCVRDMLHLCAETGAKGHVNFDAVGYEKLAIEAPEVFNELRQAVQRGQIEVVGASYGQPYGLFHGGESNVRQRVFGVRTAIRLFGVRPLTFWEEEFDFFPQLPQLLAQVGLRYASLFFQWTWHTPHLPEETVPAIWWEGQDGSRLLTAPRGPLNLHQWPEDFEALLASPALQQAQAPLLLQWLELMPSPDWMCRSEVILPPLKALLANPAFSVSFATLSEYLEGVRAHAEVRRYTLDDVFHGMSLGKNGDLFRRLSRRAEQQLLAAESLSALAGLFGRPYVSWDVYPTWELDEAWRALLIAQHHDNDECEGLCGHIGRRYYELSLGLSEHVLNRTARHLAERTAGPPGRVVVFNPLGWPRTVSVTHPQSGKRLVVDDLPAFGYRLLRGDEVAPPAVDCLEDAHTLTLRRQALTVTIDRQRGTITQIASPEAPEGWLAVPLAELAMTRGGEVERFEGAVVERCGEAVRITRQGRKGEVAITVSLADELDAIDLHYQATALPRPDGGVAAALKTVLAPKLSPLTLFHDHPYGVSSVRAAGRYRRKYPTGDWMTSPQWFEAVENPFTALQFVDMTEGQRGLLVIHDGNQALLREGERLHHILSMYDPWDEQYFVGELDVRVRLIPHGALSHAERVKLAQHFTRPPIVAQAQGAGTELPPHFAPLSCDAPNVLVTAWYREAEEVGQGLTGYAGTGLGYPYVLRLVEFDGVATTVQLRLNATVAAAWRTNLLGEISAPLAVSANTLTLTLRPFEIATVYLDLIEGRKQPRDLDARRSVWATVHRQEDACA